MAGGHDTNMQSGNAEAQDQGAAPPAPPPMPGDFHVGQPRRQAAVDPYADINFDSIDPPFRAPPARHGFKWWYAYFWRECGRARREASYRELFEPDGEEKRQMSDFHRRESLTAMLNEGFEEYSVVGNYLRTEEEAFPLIAGTTSVHVGYRGDLRVPREVEVQRGTIAKVRVFELRELMHMRDVWNPFSDPAMKGKVFFRRDQKDNCLQTVVSVAIEFMDAAKFPMLDEMALPRVGLAVVEVAELLPDGVTEKPGGKTKSCYLKASRTNIYVLKTGQVYDTRQRQIDVGGDLYDERAVGEIPWGNHLARIRVERIHYGNRANDGHLAIVRGIDWLQSRAHLEDILGGAANANALERYLDHEYMEKNGGLHAYTPVGVKAPIKIKRIVSVDIPGSWW